MQSFWGRKVITGPSLLSLTAPLMSHTETIPLVLPLTKNCPLLEKKGNLWADRHHSGGRSHSYPGAEDEPGKGRGGDGHLRVQIKVDALIGGHFPTQRPQEVARLPEIPAQKFGILKTSTGV